MQPDNFRLMLTALADSLDDDVVRSNGDAGLLAREEEPRDYVDGTEMLVGD